MASCVELRQVYPPPYTDISTYVDVIAIHGLDTKAPETWTWKHRDPNPGYQKPEEGDPENLKLDEVDWLSHQSMLRTVIPDARIFTCNWPGDLFERPGVEQKVFEQFARLLLAGIHNRDSPATINRGNNIEPRPIVFIASCLGGLILMKALVTATTDYNTVKQATRGIVFLATPFRGTSFQDVADWAESGLCAWSYFQNRSVSKLLQYIKSTPELDNLVAEFTAFCLGNDQRGRIPVQTFYELGYTSLPRKIIPRLPDRLSQKKQLVDQASARLDIALDSLPLDRPHVMMNKFSGPKDNDYKLVASTIQGIVQKARDGGPLERANKHIRLSCYSQENLKILRLSGDVLPIDHCYINLTIITIGGDNGHPVQHENSPLSFLSRFEVESPREARDIELEAMEIALEWARPKEGTEIELSSLFDPFKPGQTKPQRILIYGQAGVGKSTLCKKIVHDFKRGELWHDIFDYVLWVPLRNLKDQSRSGAKKYDLGDLFYDEYFYGLPDGEALAKALWSALPDGKPNRALFILDGLDEVSEYLAPDGMSSTLVMSNFLKKLFAQPNFIATSRPNSVLKNHLGRIDLELETIGFDPWQVDRYIESAFLNTETGAPNRGKAREVKSFLDSHELVRDLVRIPIQLDVLCYTWNEPNQALPNNITAVYQNIEVKLWKKDSLLHKNGINYSNISTSFSEEIRAMVQPERQLLEVLAFTGMINNIVEFDAYDRDAMTRNLASLRRTGLLLDATLKRVSFLRSPASLRSSHSASYHFLHLTFQEYFGAQYFARQWKAGNSLEYLILRDDQTRRITQPGTIDAAKFLSENKYNKRYDIFWRFVAGLLDADQDVAQIERFFATIEAKPRDLLCRTHHLLVMRCLSEVSSTFSLRAKLQTQLFRWVDFWFDHPLLTDNNIVSEPDFPVKLFTEYFRSRDTERKNSIAARLYGRWDLPPDVHQEIIKFVDTNWTIDDQRNWTPMGRNQLLFSFLPGDLSVITKTLLYKNFSDEITALSRMPGPQHPSSGSPGKSVIECLQDQNDEIKFAALQSLKGSLTITGNLLEAVVGCLKSNQRKVWMAALTLLARHPISSPTLRQTISSFITNLYTTPKVIALQTVISQPSISQEFFQFILRRLTINDQNIRAFYLAIGVHNIWCAQASIAVAIIRFKDLSMVPAEYVAQLYETLLEISFQEPISWQERDNNQSVVVIGREEFCQEFPDGFLDQIQAAQKKLGLL